MIAHTRVTAEGSSPSKWILVLHGILGSGGNWRSFAKALVKASPAWGAVLVDLRNHGASRGFAPPHTIEACARDLFVLGRGRSKTSPLRSEVFGLEAEAVLGHSFGGKVALEYVRQRAGDIAAAIVVDSTPAPRLDILGTDWGSLGIVRILRTLPKTLPGRNDYTKALLDRGIDALTAQWLAMNVRRREDGAFDLPLDLDAIQSMLESYFSVDLWDVALSPPGRVRVTFVAGSHGSMPEEDRERTRAKIVEAGHWVHVDAPDALLEIVTRALES